MRRAAYTTVAVVVVILITIGVSQLKPAAPSVERSTVWVETVRRGDFTRQVRGAGTLVPEDIMWISATTSGRVQRILLRPGAQVRPDTVILELTNPDLEQSVNDALLGYRSAQAAYENRSTELERALLNQQAEVAGIEASYNDAALNLEANEQLAKDGLVSQIQLKQYQSRAADLKNRLSTAQRTLKMQADGMKSQLAPQAAEIELRRAAYQLRQNQLSDLKVKAGMHGVLQVVPVEVGAQVGPGTNLARVADPSNLKAELRIPETQTRDLRIGQLAEVDTRNGVVKGRVARIDPAAVGGTVGVDVILEDELPAGARPDQSVDGTVLLEQLSDVVFVGRPAIGQENATITLYKLTADGHAVQTRVELGRSAVSVIEIRSGLDPGDQVILSDMSAHDSFERIRIVN
ncbi:MAG: HlyD family efflux transporter periplasmic adaptor subunit [Acidobacteria bacterium]|nr:HlyD family efflux transporter periplasmic adaptor subunit [Acidobacteriota bacterium]MBA3888084.1 HlyD family efflux transporter periplasmic adaptor subunit [Acidobacteriota bacterium]